MAFFQAVGGFDVLAAIFVNPGQAVAGLFAILALAPGGNALDRS